MIYTFAFANSTVGNQTGVMGSVDITTILSIFAIVISFITLFILALTLYFGHLKGVSISLSPEYELPELQANDFKYDNVPAYLPLKVSLSVLNSGNRAGIVKDFELKFKPQPDFEEFYRDIGYSIKSAKTNSPASIILINDKDTDLVIFDGSLKLDEAISNGSPLRTLNIKSDNLKTLLEKMLKYKKERLEKFIKFLKEKNRRISCFRYSEKLGELIILYSHTTERIRRTHIVLPSISIELKKKEPKVEVRYSYKATTKYYEDSLKNYQLRPSPIKIIEKVLKRIKQLKEDLENFSKEIEKHSKDDFIYFDNLELFHSIDGINLWINQILNKEDEEIELLSKCSDYREIIEKDVKPLLETMFEFYQKIREAGKIPLKTKDLNRYYEEFLKEKLNNIPFKLEDLKKKVEHELEEM